MHSTEIAFQKFRAALGQPRLPPAELIANEDQKKQMTTADGLTQWVDGNSTGTACTVTPPVLTMSDAEAAHLWVVRDHDVVHAPERCPFGAGLESSVIKHTNLTGADAAFSGGELIFLESGNIVVNGCSGRYGPRSKKELDHVVRAFVESGHGVWSMGFDEETNRPIRFMVTFPEWVV